LGTSFVSPDVEIFGGEEFRRPSRVTLAFPALGVVLVVPLAL
jgi:hypothetical protein